MIGRRLAKARTEARRLRRARPRLAWVRATLPSGATRRFHLRDFSQAQALAEVLSVVLTRLAQWSWGSNVFANWASADHPGVKVPSVRLGTLLGDQELEEVDLLKVDVEGAELLALTSDDALRRIHHVVGEVHPSVLRMPAVDAVELIREHGGFAPGWMRGPYVFELTRGSAG